MTGKSAPREYGRRWVVGLCLFVALAMLCLSGNSLAWFQSGPVPVVKSQGATYFPSTNRLVIKGENFQRGATIRLSNSQGSMGHESVKVKGGKKIIIESVAESDLVGGIDVKVINPDGGESAVVRIEPALDDSTRLTIADVQTIIAQGVAQAEASGFRATIAVVDKEGRVLGIFRMNGAARTVTVGIGTRCAGQDDCGLEGVRGVPSCAAAISKAVTGAFLSSQGHAFSTRTASFIVQEHFPPGVDFQPGGPLFGVQFSQLLCSDVNNKSPLGLSADPGGIPIYKNGIQVGGIGVEGDGRYALDPDPRDDDVPVEELVAVAAVRGFEAPPEIAGTIVVNGINFPYVNAKMPPPVTVPPFNQLRGDIDPCEVDDLGVNLGVTDIRGAQPSEFVFVTIDGVRVRVNTRVFPNFLTTRQFRSSSDLSASEVQRMLVQAAKQALVTRAAIRLPQSDEAEVNITVCDVNGEILGIVSTPDAPIFGFDVSAQKARTAAFFSKARAGRDLRDNGFGRFVDAAAQDGVKLDGSIAFTDRANGFLSRPFFPDGINDTENGPFSVPIEDFSPFNVGLQLDLILEEYFRNALRAFEGDIGAALNVITPPCPPVPLIAIANGIQIFAGSVPIYKNGRLVGSVGISGDGIDQDDFIASMGSAGFEAPAEIRSDRVFVRGVRLPWVKFPRHPNR